MGTSFDRWEKDPFFAAAEEVQESADRMESVHRQWLQGRRAALAAGSPAPAALRRDLHTVLGTAKWQLEELERAVTSTDKAWSAGEDTMARHSHFVAAIADKISTVENSLRESNLRDGEPALSWVRLDEGERDELAQFLSSTFTDKESGEASGSCSKDSFPSTESSSASARAAVDVGELKVPEESPRRPPGEQPNLPPPRILRFSGLARAIESAAKLRWYRNGFRKWKGVLQNDAAESLPLRNHQLSQDIDACYERGKNCLSSCDEFDEKQINGWTAALHRQLQRSQYQIQYGRPIQLIVWIVLAVLFIAILVLFSS